MKFKDVTPELRIIAKNIYDDTTIPWDARIAKLSQIFGKSERHIRRWCSDSKKLGFKKKNDEIQSEQYEIAKKREVDKNKNRYIISWAQNNTPVHSKFFENVKAYANFIDAEILIIAGRYKNPTSIIAEQKDDFWVQDLTPYLDANRHNIHKFLSIMSDVKIQPTATNPMSGLEGMSGINSCIFGAPKVQLETISVLEGNKPKMMMTTGAVTKMNYTDSKAGKKGEFHHVYGFVVVEIKDMDTFYARHVTADDTTGVFNDLFYHVENGQVTKINSIEAIVLGDIHCGKHDVELIDLTHKFLKNVKPNHVVLHDVFDGNSINHHEINNPFIQYSKEVNGTNSLEIEINDMISVLDQFSNYENVVIVRSNHDDFIDRWVQDGDWKKQPTTKNSVLYMEYSAMLLKQYAQHEYDAKGIIPEIINKYYPKFHTLGRRESYKVKDWELGQHGDYGINGSRGSIHQFRKLNTKIITGHSHSPGRKDGALAVGTSTKLRVGYNLGASSWWQSHVIIHNSGRAQHINFSRDINNNIGFTTFLF